MLHLLQIYNMVRQKQLFIDVFSDLEYELEEMGWSDDPETLISDLLINHFGLEIMCPKQLASITKTIINKKDLSFLKMLLP